MEPEDPSLHQRRRYGRRSGKVEWDDCAFWRNHHNNCCRRSNQNDVIHPSDWAWATYESPRPSQNGENVTKVTVILGNNSSKCVTATLWSKTVLVLNHICFYLAKIGRFWIDINSCKIIGFLDVCVAINAWQVDDLFSRTCWKNLFLSLEFNYLLIFVSYNLLINFLKGVLFVSKTFDELHLTSAIKSVASLNKQMKK